MAKLIELKRVSKIYNHGRPNQVTALKNISLSIAQGEFVAITGPSGSGKSTLMHILGLLDKPSSGKYFLEGESIESSSQKRLARLRGEKIGFVFQTFNLLPRLSVLANVLLPTIYNPIKGAKEKAMGILKELELEERISHTPDELSGGETQRVAIARALILEPAVILADEPSGNLDSRSGQKIIDLLKALNREGATIILVTHESYIAAQAQRIIKLKDGEVINPTSPRLRGVDHSVALAEGGQ